MELSKDFPGMGEPERPIVPPYLATYFELRHWNTLLVEGGILDQPAWTWMLITMAGYEYENLMTKPAEEVPKIPPPSGAGNGEGSVV